MSTATETDLEERLRHDAEKAVEIAEHKARLTQNIEEDDVTRLMNKPITFDFAFDTPNLADGVVVYDPAVNDRLIDAWFELITGWDSGNAFPDISQYTGDDSPLGLWGSIADGNTYQSLYNPDTVDEGGGPSNGGVSTLWPLSQAPLATAFSVARQDTLAHFVSDVFNLVTRRVVPAIFTTDDPLLLVVSQDGTKGGDPIIDIIGTARLCMIIASAS